MFSCFSKQIHGLSRSCKSMSQLKQLLSQIIQTGISNHPSSLLALLAFAAASPDGDFHLAASLFSQMNPPDPFAYNSMIQGSVNARRPQKAVLFFFQMVSQGLVPDKYTFTFAIKACGFLPAPSAAGEAIHARILRVGFSTDPYIQSGLIRMYSEVGEIVAARDLFDEIGSRDCVTWNSMIGGYVKCGRMEEAEDLFEEMPDKNVGAYNAMMGGFVKHGQLEKGSTLFEEMPVRDTVSWNTMIGAHARSGLVATAWELFGRAQCKNVVTWSAMISGFAQSSCYADALDAFKDMLADRQRPNQAILVSVLSSCAHLGALEQGVWIHNHVRRQGFEVDDLLRSSLIDMYSKCGMLQAAILTFDELGKKDMCSWTAMIYALAMHGHCRRALDAFREMSRLGVRPNDVTFVGILSACSHAGLVREGRDVFEQMDHVYGMKPKIEHYTCMVDLLSRASLIDEARELIESMPMEPDVFVWGALLGGIMIHEEHSLAFKDATEEFAKLEPEDSGLYVLVSNMYSSFDRWGDAERVRRRMERVGVKKKAGCSLIEVDGVVHEFLAGGRLNAKSEQLYELLNQIYKEIRVGPIA